MSCKIWRNKSSKQAGINDEVRLDFAKDIPPKTSTCRKSQRNSPREGTILDTSMGC